MNNHSRVLLPALMLASCALAGCVQEVPDLAGYACDAEERCADGHHCVPEYQICVANQEQETCGNLVDDDGDGQTDDGCQIVGYHARLGGTVVTGVLPDGGRVTATLRGGLAGRAEGAKTVELQVLTAGGRD